MSDTSFTAQLRNRARQDIEKKIRKLERRLVEVEALTTGTVNSAEAEALSVAIRESLADALGIGTFAFNQYRDAADFYSGFPNLNSQVNITETTRARSVALLKRVVQSLSERLEDDFQDATTSPASRHPSRAGRAMSGVTRLGSGVAGIGEAGTIGSAPLGELTLDATAEVGNSPQQAFDLLMARVALLEAALASPRPKPDLPIGPGHNGPPDFEPPFEERDIRELVDLLKAQTPTASTDLPKLLAASEATKTKVSKLAEYADAFAIAAAKSAGGEMGKRLVQLPWWLAVGNALHLVAQALIGWIGALPH